MRGTNFRYLEANDTVTLTTKPTTLGIITIGTKGAGGNKLSLFNAETADAAKKICELDTTAAVGGQDLGQLVLDALTAVLETGTAAKVTISWG